MIIGKEELLNNHTSLPKENNITNEEIYIFFNKLMEELLRNMDRLCLAQASETGKPIKNCKKELFRCIELIKYGIKCNSEAEVKSVAYMGYSMRYYERRIGRGRILCINTFSSPYSSFIHKVIGVLLGRGVLYFKPSPKAEKCSYELYTIISNIMSKYNDKILNFLPGINDTEMINVLSAFEFSAILFTGKSETAKIIKKYIGRIPGIFETGSSAMAYVHIDKGYEKVAKELAQASFAQSGMRCIGLKNLFVHKNTIANLLPFLLEQVYQLSVGEPLNYETDIGPIYDNQVVDRTLELINQCSKQNFKLLCGGKIIENNIMLPTILIEDGIGSIITTMEVYAPVLFVHVVDEFSVIPMEYFKRSSLNNTIYSDYKKETEQYIEYNKYSGNISIGLPPDLRIDVLPFGGFYDENEQKESVENIVEIVSHKQTILEREE